MRILKCFSTQRVSLLAIYALLFSVLFCGLLGSQKASALDPNHYAAHFTTRFDNTQQWQRNISLGVDFYPWYLYDYDWIIDSVNVTGNYANIHFETNLVLHGTPTGDPRLSLLNGKWKNLDYLTINYCGSSGSNYTIKSQSVSYATTPWFGYTPTFDDPGEQSNNVTLTIYGDVLISGLTNGQREIYCGVGTYNQWAFMEAINPESPYSPTVYFEKQPTTIQFTNDESEAIERAQLAALDNINQSIQDSSSDIVDAINNQSEKEQEKYEEQSQEVQDDLEDGSEASEQQGQTLIAMLTQFFTAIRDVPATNACNLIVSLKPYNNLLPDNYQINFCTNGAKSFLQTRSISYSLFSGDPGITRQSIWMLLSTVIFSCIIISLLFPTLNLIKKTYEELRK